MPRFPLARRALLAATVCSAAVLPGLFGSSTAWAEVPNPSACKGLHHGNPPGSLAITTDPPSGTTLRPGGEVEVTATWDPADWPEPVLHKVLNCLLVNGAIDYDRSTQEKPTGNDGLYRYRFTVPSGAEGRICDRVRLSGRLVAGDPLVVQKSNTVCFAVATGGGPGGPGTPADTSTAGAPAAASPDLGSPAPGRPAPLGPPPPLPPDAPLDAAAAPPADGPAPALEISSAANRPTLPRTGGDVLPLARLGTLLVLLGGAALVARAALSGQDCPSPQVI